MGPGWLVGALLLHVGGSLPGKNYSLPYTWQTPECKDPDSEYFEENINKCCSKCSPGYRVLQSCSSSADTDCAPCEGNTYTALWNRARRCLGCSSRCNTGESRMSQKGCSEAGVSLHGPSWAQRSARPGGDGDGDGDDDRLLGTLQAGGPIR
ncbi:FAST kinase domain-containing protein 2 [Platysternon megacephalum]|uniref:FAST kinase domain-containing protein 2 n=1 Tax=Platysternon megacephalum TaxID=55544 RepID=A0A4D9EZM9_9SAUR|nr:FAST kinase domain-containing protein 2 [Platysternon megacephalum]